MGQLNRTQSTRLYQEALSLFPGGVNSPVRAFKGVGGTPLFFERGKGARVWDEDGNEFLDFCNSWGPLIHGHAHPYVEEKIIAALKNGSSFGAPTRWENQLATLLKTHLPHLEKMRFVSSGTEAVMSALRLARGVTQKPKLLKFEGCYHGHVDSLLVKAGSGLVTLGTSSSAGVTEATAQDTLVVPLNDEAVLTETFERFGDQLAAVIIEPVPANNGLLLQDLSFLQLLRGLCWKHKVLLIFDEVISGFR
ncbi:MAG: aminotransferase class III-fold pyridoxal phosphate-dependent enzyme, partial [Flavobacteriia bacterium]|nr:aminotransferase class III-fold pyridoxal phosphate-dependent enzyme [Flavobacteriia bacterium]